MGHHHGHSPTRERREGDDGEEEEEEDDYESLPGASVSVSMAAGACAGGTYAAKRRSNGQTFGNEEACNRSHRIYLHRIWDDFAGSCSVCTFWSNTLRG